MSSLDYANCNIVNAKNTIDTYGSTEEAKQRMHYVLDKYVYQHAKKIYQSSSDDAWIQASLYIRTHGSSQKRIEQMVIYLEEECL